jgi:aspartate/methionine/tyrosine aminotransferase
LDPRAAAQVRHFGTSIFTEMSRLANLHKAVNLGQGYPDFDGPEFFKDAAVEAIRSGLNQYAVAHGEPRLRQAIATTWERQYGRSIDPDTEVSVTSGATEALFDVVRAFVESGDEVIVFEPFYDSYVPSVLLSGGQIKVVTLHAPDWSFDGQELKSAFSPRTKLLLLNTPHNPTGKVFSADELAQIAELCQDWDVVAVTDEVYDRLTFDDTVHRPLAEVPGMWDRTITINSTGKTFGMTGWKIGYLIAPTELSSAVRAVHQFVTFATSTPMQHAAAAALELAWTNGYYETLKADYTARRDQLTAILADCGLSPLPVQGSYFINADFSALGFSTDVEFCRWLTSEIGVAAVPPSAFYLDSARAPRLARFCFAKRPETLAAAAERLRDVGSRLAQATTSV